MRVLIILCLVFSVLLVPTVLSAQQVNQPNADLTIKDYSNNTFYPLASWSPPYIWPMLNIAGSFGFFFTGLPNQPFYLVVQCGAPSWGFLFTPGGIVDFDYATATYYPYQFDSSGTLTTGPYFYPINVSISATVQAVMMDPSVSTGYSMSCSMWLFR